ncbi:hypothetical protein QQ045_011159 [Rhodiola kirilowii]
MSSNPSGTIEEGSVTLNNVGDEIGGGSVLGVSVSESSDSVTRTQAWNRPVNGTAENVAVMGADSWPSLSEAANAPQRISTDNSRTVSEGAASLFNQSSSSRNNVSHTVRPNLTQNGTHQGRYRSSRNNATRSSVGNGDHSHQQRLPSAQGQVPEVSSNNGSQAGQNNGPRSQSHIGGNHPQQRDSQRRGNGGSPRVDGRRRNVDRDANTHQSYNARNGPVQPPVFPGPFPSPLLRPVLPVAPYPPPPPPFPPMQFMAPGIHPITGERIFYGPPVLSPLAMRPRPIYPFLGPQFIVSDLMKQIDYYFSDQNLVKDVHLRQTMNEHGWVLVTTIAAFKKVQQIISQAKQFLDDTDTDALQFILNVMQNSPFVEVKGDKLRKRTDWEKYILPNIVEPSSTAVENVANGELASHLNNTVLGEESFHRDFKLEVEDKATDDQARQ